MILEHGNNYKLLGYFQTGDILRKIISNNLDWNKYNFRQERYKDHSKTKTIPIIWSENFSEVKKWEPYYTIFKDELLMLENFLLNNLCPSGKIMSAILINLPSGECIGRHVDANPVGERFNRCHRIHIPITTNNQCLFEIDGEIKNMKVGEVWEISNVNKKHSVSNNGETDRIHFLIDWDPIL